MIIILVKRKKKQKENSMWFLLQITNNYVQRMQQRHSINDNIKLKKKSEKN